MLASHDYGAVFWKNVRGKFRPITGDQNRVISAGLLTPGASDLIGIKRVTITPEMVGQTIAVFAAVEVKTAVGDVKPEQENFIEKVKKYGGLAGVARSPDDLAKILRYTS